MKESKFCPNCGTESAIDAKFCPKCGYQFEQQSGQPSRQQQTTNNTAPYRSASQNQTNDSTSGFNERIDLMMKWITQNWVSTILIVVAILAFSIIMQILFYHASIGLLALIAVLVWLYSFATTNGPEATSVEMQLRHITKNSADAVKSSQQAHADRVMMQKVNAQQNTFNQQAAQNQNQNPSQVYVQTVPQSNGIGTAGFVLALISFLFSWVPGVNFLIWFLGALFSFIGLFKHPRGLAVTGFILSFLDIILIVFLISMIGTGLGLSILGNL